VVIVQVSSRLDEDIELLRLLPARMKRLSLIAVADPHRDEIERAVRGAGASCYLPNAANTALVERTVAEMLSRPQSDTINTRRPSDGAPNNQTSSLLHFAP
jgi:DNA-binding NarL/FixJ family response regulator